MSKFRSLQFLRNETINSYASHEEAIKAIKGYTPENGEAVPSVLANVNAKDGEIIMFRYKLDGDANTVHTQLVAARVDGSVKYFEIVANYDQLTNIVEHLDANVTSTNGVNVQVQVVEEDGKITVVSVSDNSINATDLTNAINGLNADKSGSNANQDITVQVVETAGLITEVKVSDTLKSVAHTGAAADVTVADAGNLIEATTVEGALAEIAKEIDDMDSSLATTDASQTTKLVKLGYTQEDGKITSLTSDETALEARLQAIENNTITGKDAIVVTSDTTTGNNEVSLNISDADQVLTQSDAGLKANLGLVYDSTNKLIKLTGKTGEGEGATPVVIAEVDATDFIKDGMLSDATIVSGTWDEGDFTESETGADKAIKFVWKTYQQGQNGQEVVLKTEYLNVESLIDAYTADEQWIHIDDATNTISHNTVNGLDSGVAHGITADVTVDSTTEKSFKVPTLTVDAAGHVVSVDEKTVTITLPESIDSAVQTINGHTINDSFITTTVTPSDDNTTQQINVTAKLGTFPAEDVEEIDGLATVADVVDYVQANSTTVSGYTKTVGEGESEVSTVVTKVVKSTNENGSTNYQVQLPEITVANTNVTNTMADDTATHSYITSIETDGFGRVVKTVTETMTEDIDCGCWDVLS